MNRNSGNVSKTKKLVSGAVNNSKPNRKSFKKLSESSSISSNRNSSAQSEEDVIVGGVYVKPQVNSKPSLEEQEQIVKKLQGQVKDLKHKVRVLEDSVDSKDYSLGTMAREKDRAIGEIRRLERSNKQLRQQLNDERNHYLEEKERFCQEMTRYKKKLEVSAEKKSSSKWSPKMPVSKQSLINHPLKWQLNKEKGDFADKPTSGNLISGKSQKLLGGIKGQKPNAGASFSCSDSHLRKAESLESFHLYEGYDLSLQMAALRTENAKLRSIICERDEQNYELCLRFLRMKHYKNDIRSRFQDLENEYLQVIANLMDKIDEARQEFNFIIDQKFKRPLHSTNAMYLQLVQRNSRMAFENASLRLENQCLKKELNKYLHVVSDYDRKVDEPEVKLETSKSDGGLKRSKKNVNFKEVKTIYKRNLDFKNSDTDSNYLSKASTGLSNGSLVDPKSNESVAGKEQRGVADPDNKPEPLFQANLLPEEILHKIFKRVDTSSCPSSDTNRSKDIANSNSKPKETEAVEIKEKSKELAKPQKEPTETGYKNRLSDSSSPSESRESVQLETYGLPRHPPNNFFLKTSSISRNQKQSLEEPEKLRGFRNRLRLRGLRLLEDSVGGDPADLPVRRQVRLEREARLFRDAESRFGNKQIKDSCGLQEKIEFSDLELPTSVENSNQVVIERSKEKQEVKETRIDTRGSQNERQNQRNPSGRVLERFEEFREVRGNQLETGDVNQNEGKIYRLDRERSNVLKNDRYDVEEVSFVSQDPTHSRRPEGSKRFSQRLISTSPEQLRSILTESQMGNCFQMPPVIVGHATAEINQTFSYPDSNNEIVLKLIIPTTVEKTSQVFLNEIIEKTTVEKETSMSGLSPIEPKHSPEVEVCPSEVRIPVSNLPTSNSTMEVVDSTTINDRNNILLRTFSAPGLLESGWLNQDSACEMKDSSTNT